MPTLLDYEHQCQQAPDLAQREQIALEALNFLMQTPAPGDIKTELEREYAGNKSPSGDAAPLPDGGLELDDAFCALLEARLANIFPALNYLKQVLPPAALSIYLARVRTICQQVDAWRNFIYWAPLLDFLQNATAGQWRLWRLAAIAQQKARAEIGNGDFERAKQFAIAGLQSLAGLPDHRLYLDLCSRVENAIAEGDACFCLATALGERVLRESLAACHYLRAVSMGHNLGNQHLITGQNARAVLALEQAKALCEQHWPIKDMNHYQVNLLERLARAYLNRGEVARATEHLEKFHADARQPRELALYHLGKGYLALHAGQPQTAKIEFKEACNCARGRGGNNLPDDFFNLWSAHVSLGLACLKGSDSDEARTNLEEARQRGAERNFLNNPHRKIHDWLLDAEISILDKVEQQAETALRNAEGALNGLASPRRRMQLLLTKASLRELKPKAGEDPLTLRAEAIQIANDNGFDTSDIDQLKLAVFA
jgi:hypothetical protein